MADLERRVRVLEGQMVRVRERLSERDQTIAADLRQQLRRQLDEERAHEETPTCPDCNGSGRITPDASEPLCQIPCSCNPKWHSANAESDQHGQLADMHRLIGECAQPSPGWAIAARGAARQLVGILAELQGKLESRDQEIEGMRRQLNEAKDEHSRFEAATKAYADRQELRIQELEAQLATRQDRLAEMLKDLARNMPISSRRDVLEQLATWLEKAGG